MEPQPKPQLSMVRKLAEVMAEVTHVPKNGSNNFHGYKYSTEADVVASVRREMAKRALMLVPSVVKTEWGKVPRNKGGEDRLCTLTVRFTIIDGESGEERSFEVMGEGQDPGDKATYKAMTGAVKYALLKLFLIPTGDDPEHEEEEDTGRGRKGERRQHREEPREEPRRDAGPTEEQKKRMGVCIEKMKSLGIASSREEAAAFIRSEVGPEPYHTWGPEKWEALVQSIAKRTPKPESAPAAESASASAHPATDDDEMRAQSICDEAAQAKSEDDVRNLSEAAKRLPSGPLKARAAKALSEACERLGIKPKPSRRPSAPPPEPGSAG